MKQLEMEGIPKSDFKKQKRNWENAFQSWSNRNSQDGKTALGSCGNGYICDWCSDQCYGRPCVRALNTMCKEKGLSIDYTKRNFEEIWSYGKTIDRR